MTLKIVQKIRKWFNPPTDKRESLDDTQKHEVDDIYEIEDIDDVDDLDMEKQIFANCKNEEEVNDLVENFLGTIQFTILGDGRVFINCGWADSSDEVAELYGHFLFLLNEGRLAKNVLEYLLQFGSQNVKMGKFATKIIEGWHTIDENENNKPIISPTKVFMMQQFGQNNMAVDEE